MSWLSKLKLFLNRGPLLALAILIEVLASQAATRADDGLDRIAGRSLFNRNWVPAPASVDGADGLGPVFNARSCAACHPRADAAPSRAQPDGSIVIGGAILRIAGPDGIPDPWYGRQLQTEAVPGLKPEARVRLTADSATEAAKLDVELLGPPLAERSRMGLRIAPTLAGRAELELIDVNAVLAREAANRDSASSVGGRAHFVPGADGKPVLGRFGWKARQPDLIEQTADAFATDLGLSSPRRPTPYGDCTPLQTDCLSLPHGESRNFDGREVSGQMLDLVVTYLKSRETPERHSDPVAEKIFDASGCGACHAPTMPRVGGGIVRAFTDLLLHDMGSELDDGVAEPGVASREWRTAPLISIAPKGQLRRYLHDGRAGDIATAIRAHGGEAAPARKRFDVLSPDQREILLRYLERL